MKTLLFRASAAVLLTLFVAAQATAHFVWINSDATSIGLLVRCGFGALDGWDADLVERMSKSVFWTRKSGETKTVAVPLDAKEKEYRAMLPGPSPDAVLAATDFGVIAFGGNPPSWLRYTAKHLVGKPETWNDEKPTK